MPDIGDFEPDDLRNVPTFRAAYSDRTALLMAKLAFRAYTKFDVDDQAWLDFSETFRKLGLVESAALIDREVGTAGFAVAGSDLIIVVFRGTEDDLDWTTNMQLAWVALEGGTRVHTGFFQAYWPIREALFAAIEKLLKAKPRPVYVTGHSLGGALALMATAELANHRDQEVRDSIAACYTFGCPRAGDASFDQYVKVPLYRVTNGVDLVPAIPPALLGYRHVGDTRYFGRPGLAPIRRSPNLLVKVWTTLLGLISLIRTGKLLNMADHGMDAYLGKLAAWAGQNIKQTQARREKTADPELKDPQIRSS
jgi:triacylglycerol lipase